MVDPIDGPQPYVSGLSSCGVSLGFVRNGTIAFGMVYAPARGELFAGAEEFPPMFGRFIERGGMLYCNGSGALTLCCVAAGQLLGYIEWHINA